MVVSTPLCTLVCLEFLNRATHSKGEIRLLNCILLWILPTLGFGILLQLPLGFIPSSGYLHSWRGCFINIPDISVEKYLFSSWVSPQWRLPSWIEISCYFSLCHIFKDSSFYSNCRCRSLCCNISPSLCACYICWQLFLPNSYCNWTGWKCNCYFFFFRLWLLQDSRVGLNDELYQ